MDVQRNLWDPVVTRSQADSIERLLDSPPAGQVLDVPCGLGRHSIELALEGYTATGIDISAEALAVARKQSSAECVVVRWEQRDMRDLPWEEEFDGAFCFFGSFGYFDEEGNLAFLKAVGETLKNGARLLIDTHTAESLLPRLISKNEHRMGEVQLIEELRHDESTGRIEGKWTLMKGNRTEVKTSSIRLYALTELRALMQSAGFEVLSEYGSLMLEPFRTDSRRLYLLARRKH